MNTQNMDKAIAVMERAKLHNAIRMKRWQTAVRDGEFVEIEIDGTAARTENELHACGNKACFAGYLAVSPEWLSTPGFGVISNGSPKQTSEIRTREPLIATGFVAVAIFLGISTELAMHFVTNSAEWEFDTRCRHPLYKIHWEDVRAEHVIRELTLLRDLGEDEYIKKVVT